MTAARVERNRHPSRVLMALAALSWPVGSLPASDHSSPPAVRGPLDGLSFSGEMGPPGEPGRSDVLYFNDGQFWSKNCVPCGFEPGAYWVRQSGDGIHFQGTLESEQSGEFRYTGVVRTDRIDVDIHWRKERWYWTIDRKFRFAGRLDQASPPSAAMEAARMASLVGADKVCVPGE